MRRLVERWLVRGGPDAACISPDHGLDPKRLVEMARQNVAENPTADFRETLGAALYRNGQFAEAITVLAKVRDEQCENATPWTELFLAMAYLRQGDPAWAHSLIQSATDDRGTPRNRRLIHDQLHAEVERLVDKK